MEEIMANSTFNGPVRSEGGFEQITKSSTTGAITTNFDIDSSGNITGTGTSKITGATNIVVPYTSITDATYTVTTAMSGTTFGFNRAAGIVVTLPTPAAGLNYKFLVETTFSGAGQIKTATTDGTDGFLGTAFLFDTGEIGETDNFHPAASNDVIDSQKLVSSFLRNSIKSLCGKYSFRKSIALISKCKYALAADSGLGHVSAALSVPTISIFGAGLSSMTAPVGQKINIINKNVLCSPCRKNICYNYEDPLICIREISSEDIEIAINSIINP